MATEGDEMAAQQAQGITDARERTEKNRGPTNAEIQHRQMTRREKWAAEYDAGPETVTATQALKRNRPEVMVLEAVGYEIDLGRDVYGAFTASAKLFTEGVPTARAVVTAAEIAVARAKQIDAGHNRDAAIEQYAAHPFEMALPEPTLPAAEEALALAKIKAKAMDDALAEVLQIGLKALKEPKVESVLQAAWAEKVHPVIDPATMLGAEVNAAEDAATGAANAIEAVYSLHLGGGTSQEKKLLRDLFADRPAEMPTIATVYETTQAHRIENEKRQAEYAEANAAKRAANTAEAAEHARFRNPQRQEG